MTVHTVGGSGYEFTTIQAAINSAGTVNGDTIEVYYTNGKTSFQENVTINKQITLTGIPHPNEGYRPSIYGTGSTFASGGGTGIFVSVSNVHISGFNIHGFDYGILVNDEAGNYTTNNGSISNCYISDCYYQGTYICHSTTWAVSDITYAGIANWCNAEGGAGYNALKLYFADYVTVSNVKADNIGGTIDREGGHTYHLGDAVSALYSDHLTVDHLDCAYVHYGVWLLGCDYGMVQDSTLGRYDEQDMCYYNITFEGARWCTVKNTSLYGGGRAVECKNFGGSSDMGARNSSNITITNCAARHNIYGYAIYGTDTVELSFCSTDSTQYASILMGAVAVTGASVYMNSFNYSANWPYGARLEVYTVTGNFWLNNIYHSPPSGGVQHDIDSGTWVSSVAKSYTYDGDPYTLVVGNYWVTFTGGNALDSNGDGITDGDYAVSSITDTAPLYRNNTFYGQGIPSGSTTINIGVSMYSKAFLTHARTTKTAPMSVLINGTEYPVKYDSITIEKTLGKGGTSSFTVVDLNNAYSFRPNTMVTIDRDYARVFLGWISSVQIEPINSGSKWHHIDCIGTQYITDKWRGNINETNSIGGVLAQYTPAEFARAFCGGGTVLSLDGVTYGAPTIPYHADSIPMNIGFFENISVTEVLDQVAAYDNCYWYIDDYKRLWFLRVDDYIPQAYFTENDMLRGTIRLTIDEPKFCTAVAIGNVYTERKTNEVGGETVHGNGVTRSFAFSRPIDEIIELRENGTLIDKSHIGSKGSDEDDENFWYFWSQGDREILQRTGRTILTGKDTLMIKYYYNENMTIQTYNQTAVNDLAARDGTAGFLFYGEDSDNRFSRDTAATYGLNLIAQGTAGVQKKLTFTQRRVYVAPGYKVRVTSTTLGLSGEDFLVQRVRYVGNQFDWQYEIECVNKYCTSDWSNYLGSR